VVRVVVLVVVRVVVLDGLRIVAVAPDQHIILFQQFLTDKSTHTLSTFAVILSRSLDHNANVLSHMWVNVAVVAVVALAE